VNELFFLGGELPWSSPPPRRSGGKELDCAGELAAHSVERGADFASQAGHCGDGGEADEAGNQGVLDEILTRLFLQQILEYCLHDDFSSDLYRRRGW
jgi:hypothetical protein